MTTKLDDTCVAIDSIGEALFHLRAAAGLLHDPEAKAQFDKNYAELAELRKQMLSRIDSRRKG